MRPKIILGAVVAAIAWRAHAHAAPLSPAAYYELYKAVMAIEDPETLVSRTDDIERLVEFDRDNHETLAALAEARAANGNIPGAIDAYLEVRRSGSIYKNYAAQRLAHLHALLDDRDGALAWIDIALTERRSLARLARDPAFDRYKNDPDFRSRFGIPDASVSGREAEWRFDLELLRREARRMRFGYDEPAVPDAFDTNIDQLIAHIGELSDDEIWMEARRLVAGITDGHTFVGGPAGDTARDFDTRVLPVTFFDFDDGLYIVDATPEWSHLIGAEVIDLGDLDREALIAAIDPYVQADNARTVRYIGVQLGLRRSVFLRALELADDSGGVNANLRLVNGEPSEVVLPSGDFDVGRKLTPAHLETPPAFLSRIGENYWWERLSDETLFIQINSFRNSRNAESLSEFADVIAAESASTRNMIVDVRHNNGGNANLSVPLMRALLAFENASPEKRVFVITSHMSFSATQVFISRLDAFGNPIFVGTPSGASPNFTGEEEGVVLPFSKLSVSFSPLHWQNTTPVDHRAWIEMDVPVAFTGADYVAGRDAALEAILEIICKSG